MHSRHAQQACTADMHSSILMHSRHAQQYIHAQQYMHSKLSLIHACSTPPPDFKASACHATLQMQAQSDSWQSMNRPELMKLGRSSW